MSIQEKQNKIVDKCEVLIKQKFNNRYFYCSSLFDSDNYDFDLHYNIFKYLFNLNSKDSQIYLWNAFYDEIFIYKKDIKNIDYKKFSTEEYNFICNIASQCSMFNQKYGDNFNYNFNKPISTKNLIIKPFDNNLNNQYFNHFLKNKVEFESYYGKEYSKQEVINNCQPQYGNLHFAILLKNTNQFIGSIALTKINSVKYNIEYYILPQYRNMGYASQTVECFINNAFNNKLYIFKETIKKGVYKKIKVNIKCIYAQVDTNNISSIKLLEKFNFINDGIIKYDRKFKNNFYDSYIFTLIK